MNSKLDQHHNVIESLSIMDYALTTPVNKVQPDSPEMMDMVPPIDIEAYPLAAEMMLSLQDQLEEMIGRKLPNDVRLTPAHFV